MKLFCYCNKKIKGNKIIFFLYVMIYEYGFLSVNFYVIMFFLVISQIDFFVFVSIDFLFDIDDDIIGYFKGSYII